MGNVTPLVADPKQFFPRRYVKGFIASPFVTYLRLAGGRLQSDYTPLNGFMDLKVAPHFLSPGRGTWSVDGCFDWTDSWFYSNGSPFAVSVFLKLFFCPLHEDYRICVISHAGFDERFVADLPPPATNWRPPDP